MINVNRIGNIVTGSYAVPGGENKDFSFSYNKEQYDLVKDLEAKGNQAFNMAEYKETIKMLEEVTKEPLFDKIVHESSDQLYVDPNTGKFYLKVGSKITSVPLPQGLVNRIITSFEKGIDFQPIIKFWIRFLRNPKVQDLYIKGLNNRRGDIFSERVFNYLDMKYINPDKVSEYLASGKSSEVAEELATGYQVKITEEGLMNAFKVSKEVTEKYNTETGELEPRYVKTFNADTGKVESEGFPAYVENRLFKPSIMGDQGDAFSCIGTHVNEVGHFIRVGCEHSLDSENKINWDDAVSCVPGLHVGGLNYISRYSGEIHNVFVDPADIRAVPDSVDGAIRCIRYFVHSSWTGETSGIYHSSKYAAQMDDVWAQRKLEILEQYSKSLKQRAEQLDEISQL